MAQRSELVWAPMPLCLDGDGLRMSPMSRMDYRMQSRAFFAFMARTFPRHVADLLPHLPEYAKHTAFTPAVDVAQMQRMCSAAYGIVRIMRSKSGDYTDDLSQCVQQVADSADPAFIRTVVGKYFSVLREARFTAEYVAAIHRFCARQFEHSLAMTRVEREFYKDFPQNPSHDFKAPLTWLSRRRICTRENRWDALVAYDFALFILELSLPATADDNGEPPKKKARTDEH